jgi:hypothetical protein
MGFMHHDNEVFYEDGKYRKCSTGEDKECSKKFMIALDVDAHFNYMGYNFLTFIKNKCSSRRRFLKSKTGRGSGQA